MKKRPIGLTIFAVINFIFAGLTLLSFLVTVLSPGLREKAGLNLSVYTVLSPLVTSGLLIVSGIGFLKLSYRAGFLAGIALCILSLGNIVVFNALRGFEGFILHVPSMIYPTVLFLMLTFRYKQAFSTNKGPTEQTPAGNVLKAVPEE